jgi:hypothetical protein
MHAALPPSFSREMGCTVDELLAWLPGATAGAPLQLVPGEARIGVAGGALRLRWQALPPRRIALLSLPRLAVQFDFSDVADDARQQFMRHFDLYTQRGGG